MVPLFRYINSMILRTGKVEHFLLKKRFHSSCFISNQNIIFPALDDNHKQNNNLTTIIVNGINSNNKDDDEEFNENSIQLPRVKHRLSTTYLYHIDSNLEKMDLLKDGKIINSHWKF
ncbi:unnamed protein product [Rhizophagus irregularis]|nr:unnamed protein product [Rhizophagus irregularis]